MVDPRGACQLSRGGDHPPGRCPTASASPLAVFFHRCRSVQGGHTTSAVTGPEVCYVCDALPLICGRVDVCEKPAGSCGSHLWGEGVGENSTISSRSVYRRNKCADELYGFGIDNVNLICKFVSADDDDPGTFVFRCCCC